MEIVFGTHFLLPCLHGGFNEFFTFYFLSCCHRNAVRLCNSALSAISGLPYSEDSLFYAITLMVTAKNNAAVLRFEFITLRF
jgi:hypothetical protein